jgi:methylated-DNA-[protein]-cysteine S-methyltransferase
MSKSSAPLALLVDRIHSPIGTILVVHDAAGHLRALDFHDYESRMRRLLRLHYGEEDRGHVLNQAHAPLATRRALEDYFSGDHGAIDSLPVATAGTEFQREVWAALRAIRPGTTLSYSALAQQLGRPRAVRAVGLANGANSIGIVVPCHRVIGADCSLTGYGGGLPRKRWLLEHEGGAFKISPGRHRAVGIS